MSAEQQAAQAAAPSAPALWAIVEIFGHTRIAGRISEQSFGGAALVRVDVPPVTVQEACYAMVNGERERVMKPRTIPAHTRSLGGGAIYSINWVDEATATVAAQSIKHEPISAYSIREALQDMQPEHRARLLPLMAPRGDLLDNGDEVPF